MLAVFEVKQRPELTVSFQDYVSTTTSIAAIGSAVLDKFLTVKVKISSATVARPGTELDVIDEIGRRQP
jgi:hypothetical protein